MPTDPENDPERPCGPAPEIIERALRYADALEEQGEDGVSTQLVVGQVGSDLRMQNSHRWRAESGGLDGERGPTGQGPNHLRAVEGRQGHH